MVNTWQSISKLKGVKIVHLNVRSLLPKFDQLKLLAKHYEQDVIIISETWTTSAIPVPIISLSNYSMVRFDRQVKNIAGKIKVGGGICVYINKRLNFSVQRKNTTRISDNNIEMVWFTLLLESGRATY